MYTIIALEKTKDLFLHQKNEKTTNFNAIELRLSALQAHSSLGIGEKLHGPIVRICSKMHNEYPHTPIRIAFNIAVQATNETITERALVPSRLVFPILPIFPILNTIFPNQNNTTSAIKEAQAKMNLIVIESRV